MAAPYQSMGTPALVFLQSRCQAQAHGYRKLFDGKHGATHIEAEDIMALGARMRASHDKGPVGALAAVVPNEHVEAVGRVLGMLAATQRSMRLFRQLGPARKWIKGQPGSPMARP